MNLKALQELKPRIVIDTREQAPLAFRHLESCSGTLYAGDYGIDGAIFAHSIAIERKSLPDLVQSITGGRERFERELLRLRSYRFRRVLIEATEKDVKQHRYRSRANPKAIMNSIYAFEIRYDVQFVFSGTREESAIQLERWVSYYFREQMKVAEWFLGQDKKTVK